MTFENPSQNQIFDILKQAKNIAVVGLSNKPDRTSYKLRKFYSNMAIVYCLSIQF